MPIQNITRFDYQRNHSWVVRIRRSGRSVVKHFSDGQHGGKREALKQAIAFRDQTLQRLPPRIYVLSRSVRSKTGVVGVTLRVQPSSSGPPYKSYVANWPSASGERIIRPFSVRKYGKRRAFALAVTARRQGVALLKKTVSKVHPRSRRRARTSRRSK